MRYIVVPTLWESGLNHWGNDISDCVYIGLRWWCHKRSLTREFGTFYPRDIGAIYAVLAERYWGVTTTPVKWVSSLSVVGPKQQFISPNNRIVTNLQSSGDSKG
jgi:hypothetical protein